jgi:hypothetical protein
LRYSAATTFVFAWLFMNSGCDPVSHGPNTPDPRGLEHHQHLVIMHIRAVNHASDTLGTASVKAYSGAIGALRDGGKRLTRQEATMGYMPVPLQIASPDSEVHTCSTYIDHFVGYQAQYGGDTTRYGEMDRYGPWAFRFDLVRGTAVFAAGESAPVGQSLVDGVPDTVRSNGVLDLDILIDMNGLLQWRPLTSKFYLSPERIHVEQR